MRLRKVRCVFKTEMSSIDATKLERSVAKELARSSAMIKRKRNASLIVKAAITNQLTVTSSLWSY